MIKIKDNEHLVRDAKSNAVLNTDISSLQRYRAKRNKDKQMLEDFNDLKKEVSELKELITQLVSRESNK